LHIRRLLVPESPRWLAVHGKYEEVTKLINKICKINGRKMAENFDPQSLLEEVNERFEHFLQNDVFCATS